MRTLSAERLAELERAAADLCGKGAYLPPGPDLARYHTDPVSQATAMAPVLRPRNTDEVAALVRFCGEIGQPLAIQGGLTGLVGAALPQPGEVVLTTERMTDLSIDPEQGTALAGAGVTLAALNDAAAEYGLAFPVDMGSRGSARVGGMIATNAGGNRVLRYGMTRASVLGIEAVLADGTVLSNLRPLVKDNTGYDLKQLFIGSEGTLGIVTRACLRLQPIPQARRIALVVAPDFEAVASLLGAARRTLGPTLTAFEVMWRDYVDDVLGLDPSKKAALPGAAPLYVLLEASGADVATCEAALVDLLVPWLEAKAGSDATISQSEQQNDNLWALRDMTGEAARSLAPWAGFDVSLPLGRMEDWVAETRAALARAGYDRIQTYGHMGDGNLHLVVGLGQGGPERKQDVDRIVYSGLKEREGSVSAEHGIGLTKRQWLPQSRSPAEIDGMRRLKRAFDPAGLLNPGRLFQMEDDT